MISVFLSVSLSKKIKIFLKILFLKNISLYFDKIYILIYQVIINFFFRIIKFNYSLQSLIIITLLSHRDPFISNSVKIKYKFSYIYKYV